MVIKLESQSRTVKYCQDLSLCLGKLNKLICVGARSHEWFLDNNWNMWSDFQVKKEKVAFFSLTVLPRLERLLHKLTVIGRADNDELNGNIGKKLVGSLIVLR